MMKEYYNPIKTSPKPRGAETVEVRLKNGDHYLGYVQERNQMLGEPTVYFYVIDDHKCHSGVNVFIKETDIESMKPWKGPGQEMIWL